MKHNDVHSTVYEQIEAELLSGEDLLWVGQPHSSSLIDFVRSGSGFAFVIIGLLICVILGLLVAMSRQSIAPIAGLFIVGTVVVCSIIGLIITLLSNAIRARNTIYAITDRRVLIMSGRRLQTVRSYGEQDIQFIERTMRGKTCGDLIFKREPHRNAAYYGDGIYGSGMVNVPVGFFNIDNVRQVEAILFETFRSSGFTQKSKRRELDDTPEEVEFEERDTRRLQK